MGSTLSKFLVRIIHHFSGLYYSLLRSLCILAKKFEFILFHIFSASEGFEYRITYINEEGLGNVPQPPGSTWNTPNQFGIFIIQKFFIEFQREIPLNIYYILSGTIYEAPTLSNVFLHRTAEAFLSMEKIFDTLSEMSRFSLYEGYTWDNLEVTSKINSDIENADSKNTNSGEEESLGTFLLFLFCVFVKLNYFN